MSEPCPVCACTSSADGRCPRCGWLMEAVGVLGAWDDDELDAWAGALEQARRRWDVRAALRASGPPGRRDEALFVRLVSRCVRGGPVTGAERARLERDLAIEDVLPTEGPADQALARLVEGECTQVDFVVFDARGVRRFLVRAGDLGCPELVEPPMNPRVDWEELPGLAADEDVRRFHLAGGHGRQSVAWQALEESLAEAVYYWSAQAADAVFLWAVPGWAAAHTAAAVIRKHAGHSSDQLVPTAEGQAGVVTDHEGLIDHLLRRAPLRHPYALVLAEVGRDRDVQLQAHELFGRGAVGPQERSATVRVPAAGTGQTLLPVVARCGEEPKTWRLITLGRAALPPGDSAQLTVALEGPGKVRFLAPAGVTAEDGAWEDVLAQVPRRFDPAALPVDLVCAVELCGATYELDERVEFLRRTIEHCDRVCSASAGLRVGLLGYVDHRFPPQPDDPVLPHPLGLPDEAYAAMKRWAPAPRENDLGAALEDALAALPRMAWRPGSLRVLLIVGSRAPHAAVQASDRGFNRCPNGLDWASLLRRARDACQLRCVTVRGAVPWQEFSRADKPGIERVEAAWRRLGDAGQFDLAEAAPADIVSAIGVGADPDAGPLPLALVQTGLEETHEVGW